MRVTLSTAAQRLELFGPFQGVGGVQRIRPGGLSAKTRLVKSFIHGSGRNGRNRSFLRSRCLYYHLFTVTLIGSHQINYDIYTAVTNVWSLGPVPHVAGSEGGGDTSDTLYRVVYRCIAVSCCIAVSRIEALSPRVGKYTVCIELYTSRCITVSPVLFGFISCISPVRGMGVV